MELSVRNEKKLCVISVQSARIDASVALQFKDAMRAHSGGEAERILLDLSAVDFIDSSGLGAIVAAMKSMEEHRKLMLAGFTPAVERVFRLTRMDTVFRIFPTLEGALDTLGAE